MIERTTVRLPKELLTRAKRKALAEHRTLTSLIEEGLRLVVHQRRKLPQIDRGPLPVSTATGGTLPGSMDIFELCSTAGNGRSRIHRADQERL